MIQESKITTIQVVLHYDDEQFSEEQAQASFLAQSLDTNAATVFHAKIVEGLVDADGVPIR